MTDLHDKEKGKKMEYLNGMKPCKHKKTFYGMLGGRCIKCGGYLNSVGWNKRLSIKNRKEVKNLWEKKLHIQSMIQQEL